MSDCAVQTAFLRLRWPETDGKPAWPDCSCTICYACPRPSGQLWWHCKAYRRLLNHIGHFVRQYELPLRSYLLAVSTSCNEIKGYNLSGVGKTVEADGAYLGSYVKPANHTENHRDCCLIKNQNGKRQCVVVTRQRDGRMMPSAFKTETSVLAYTRNLSRPAPRFTDLPLALAVHRHGDYGCD